MGLNCNTARGYIPPETWKYARDAFEKHGIDGRQPIKSEEMIPEDQKENRVRDLPPHPSKRQWRLDQYANFFIQKLTPVHLGKSIATKLKTNLLRDGRKLFSLRTNEETNTSGRHITNDDLFFLASLIFEQGSLLQFKSQKPQDFKRLQEILLRAQLFYYDINAVNGPIICR